MRYSISASDAPKYNAVQARNAENIAFRRVILTSAVATAMVIYFTSGTVSALTILVIGMFVANEWYLSQDPTSVYSSRGVDLMVSFLAWIGISITEMYQPRYATSSQTVPEDIITVA